MFGRRRKSPGFFGPARRRSTFRLGFIAIAVFAIAAADRLGIFGNNSDDIARYDNQSAPVVHNVDGDTLDVGIPDSKNGYAHTRLRLWGVDTPETVDPRKPVEHFGPEASAYTKHLTAGQMVKLHLVARHTRDKYNRLLAYVELPDGQLLNRLLVENGYAYADPRYPHPYQQEFRSLMNKARREKRGLWADIKETDLPYYLADHRRAAEAVP